MPLSRRLRHRRLASAYRINACGAWPPPPRRLRHPFPLGGRTGSRCAGVGCDAMTVIPARERPHCGQGLRVAAPCQGGPLG
jgi:hypothetical protein